MDKKILKEVEERQKPIQGQTKCSICGKSIFDKQLQQRNQIIKQQLKDGTIVEIQTEEKGTIPVIFKCGHSVHYSCLPMTEESQHQLLKIVEQKLSGEQVQKFVPDRIFQCVKCVK